MNSLEDEEKKKNTQGKLKRKRGQNELTDIEVAIQSAKSEIEGQKLMVEDIIHTLRTNYGIDLSQEDPDLTSGRKIISASKTRRRSKKANNIPIDAEIIDLTGDIQDGLDFKAEDTGKEAKSNGRVLRSNANISCTACLDMFKPSDTFKGKCGHEFCRACLKTMFLMATENEENYPPHCCKKPLPTETIYKILTPTEIRAYQEKVDEYSETDRLYCASPKCSKFIPKSEIREEHGTCRACKKQTHTLCRALAHPKIDCPKDEALKQLLKVAKDKHWKRCKSCGAMVSHRSGCYHMTCR